MIAKKGSRYLFITNAFEQYVTLRTFVLVWKVIFQLTCAVKTIDL
jgi:hypothetical protein